LRLRPTSWTVELGVKMGGCLHSADDLGGSSSQRTIDPEDLMVAAVEHAELGLVDKSVPTLAERLV
jgi:hypothetical protein